MYSQIFFCYSSNELMYRKWNSFCME